MSKAPTKAAAPAPAPAPAAKAKPASKPAAKSASAKSESSKSASAKTETEPKAKAPAKAAAAPKGKAVAPPKDGKKPNALQQPLQPSEALAAVIGDGTVARGEAVSKVWVYIKANKLQNPDDGREIIADDKLKKIFGKDRVTMFEMNKHLAANLK